MRRRSYAYTALTIAWLLFGIFVGEKIFANDKVADFVISMCFASVGVLISFALEFLMLRLKKEKENGKL